MTTKTNNKHVLRAVQILGGRTPGALRRAAEQLGVTYQAVQAWVARGRVPPARALTVSRLTGIPPHRLCPGVFSRS